jgi:hypothetical protein
VVGDSTFLSPSGPRVPCKWYPMDTERIFPQIRSVQGKRGGPAKLYLPLLLIADQLSACSIATSQAHARRLKGLGLQLSRGGRGGAIRRGGAWGRSDPTIQLHISILCQTLIQSLISLFSLIITSSRSFFCTTLPPINNNPSLKLLKERRAKVWRKDRSFAAASPSISPRSARASLPEAAS